MPQRYKGEHDESVYEDVIYAAEGDVYITMCRIRWVWGQR